MSGSHAESESGDRRTAGIQSGTVTREAVARESGPFVNELGPVAVSELGSVVLELGPVAGGGRR